MAINNDYKLGMNKGSLTRLQMQFGAVKLTEFGNQKFKARVDRRLGRVRLSQMATFLDDPEHSADQPEQNPQ